MNIIEKLNNIDVNDLKNIDLNEVKTYLIQHLDVSASLIVALVSLFVAFKGYDAYERESKQLNAKLVTLQKSAAALKIDKQATKEFDEFLEAFPKILSINELSEKLTAFASENNVRIKSYTPGNTKEKNNIETNSLTIETTANNYDDMVAFIQKIENSDFAIRIANWIGRQGRLQTKNQNKDSFNATLTNERISASIKVETIKIHEN